MNGMIVSVVKKVMVEPRAPRAPILLSENPAYSSAKMIHSDAPRKRAPPRIPKAGYSQKIKGAVADKGNHQLRSVLVPLGVAKGREDVGNRGTQHVVLQIVAQQAERGHCRRDRPDQMVGSAGATGPHDILLQQIKRGREQRDVFNQKGRVI